MGLNGFRRIIYRSRATSGFDLDALLGMLVDARERNAARRVTGVLIHERGRFLQALEGPAHEIDDLWAVIQRDRRHDEVELLSLADVPTRWFGDWSMGLVDADTSPMRFAGRSNARLAMPLDCVSSADDAITVLRPFADFADFAA